jgi:flagellar motility protein MotE (MotC chaperone)
MFWLAVHGDYSSAQSTNFASIDLIAKEEDLARAMEQQRQELQALVEERNKLTEATTQFQRDRVALEVSKCVLNLGSHC